MTDQVLYPDLQCTTVFNCIWCEQTFVPEDEDQEFCSDQCQDAYNGLDEILDDDDKFYYQLFNDVVNLDNTLGR